MSSWFQTLWHPLLVTQIFSTFQKAISQLRLLRISSSIHIGGQMAFASNSSVSFDDISVSFLLYSRLSLYGRRQLWYLEQASQYFETVYFVLDLFPVHHCTWHNFSTSLSIYSSIFWKKLRKTKYVSKSPVISW